MVTRPRKIPKEEMLWRVIIDRDLQQAFRVEGAKQGVSMRQKISERGSKYLYRQPKRKPERNQKRANRMLS